MTPAAAFDVLFEALAIRAADIIAARLSAPASHYGTSPDATVPPGRSLSWARRNLKAIPGARKVGKYWTIAISDYDAWMTDQDTARCRGLAVANDVGGRPVHSLTVVSDSDIEREQRTERILRAAGYRYTK